MAAARQPRAATQVALRALGIVTDCVTPRRLAVHPVGDEPAAIYAVAFGPNGNPVPLPAKAGGPSGLLLSVRHQFAVIPEDAADSDPTWHVTSRAYQYGILDSLERELLVYHWQPGGMTRGPDFPHLHVSAVLEALTATASPHRLLLDKRHLPTGHVSLAAVVRLLIAEFGITYRHRDWPARLARSEDMLRQTWPLTTS